jgi:hypothetical protein
MSGLESFLSRWSRRKAESAEHSGVSPGGGPTPCAAEAKPDEREASLAAPTEMSEPPAVRAFDPESLPSIASVAAGADIRPFLQSGVPAELTRAALRLAWATDPAVRDFVGIAEAQWDFNDPTAMPGFGPLRVADDAASLAAQMLGSASDCFAKIPVSSVSQSPAMPEAGSAHAGDPVDKLRQTPAPAAEGLADAQTAGFAEEQNKENIAGEHDGALGESGARRIHRSHGRALPQ